MDVQGIKQGIGSEHAESWKFLSIFLRESDACLTKLTNAIAANDSPSSRNLLHQMLGATRIIDYAPLEQRLLDVQNLVKSSGAAHEAMPILAAANGLLDGLFDYLMEMRPTYHMHLCVPSPADAEVLQACFGDSEEITSASSIDIASAIRAISSSETDLVIYDDRGNDMLLTQLSAGLKSAYNETPILLVSQHPVDAPAAGRKKTIYGVRGCIDMAQWPGQCHMAIKTIANGRDYWPKMSIVHPTG